MPSPRPGRGPAGSGLQPAGLRRRALRCNLAEEPQGVGFVAPFLVRRAELQRPLRLGIRLVQAAGQQIRLAQPDHSERMVD